MIPAVRQFIAVFIALTVCGAGASAQVPMNRALGEQVVFIPHGSGLSSVELEMTIFRPPGDGPFPLVVINHGREFGDPHFQPRARFIVVSRELVRRGYVVALPMRGGFSKSGGSYVKSGCNVAADGETQAGYLRSAIVHLATQPYVDARRILVVGQSHGGLTALAFATRPSAGVLGIVNFAGGLRQDACTAWENNLVSAFANYGARSKLPGLWFYGDNDSYWAAWLSKKMHSEFTAAGGKARLVAFGAFKNDAHNLFGDRDGLKIWWPEFEKFLVELGLPTKLLARGEETDPEAVRLADVARVPHVQRSEACRNFYQIFLDADFPRAYAISGAGRCGYAYGGENPQERALEFCRGKTAQTCKLYAVDDRVVWEQ